MRYAQLTKKCRKMQNTISELIAEIFRDKIQTMQHENLVSINFPLFWVLTIKEKKKLK